MIEIDVYVYNPNYEILVQLHYQYSHDIFGKILIDF